MSTSHLPVDNDGSSGAGRVLAALDRWALDTPTATAVSAADGTLDFVELAHRTRAVAGMLAERGVRPGTAVGVGGGRSRLTVPGLLAVWWLGATAVPVDDRYPADRVNFILRDAGVDLLLADRIAPGVVPAGVRRVGIEDASGFCPDLVVPAADECAYVIYTSGTTGWPKGVEVTYGNLGTLLAALADLGLTPGGVGANPLSPAFDGWLWCTLLFLLHGQGTAIIDLADGEPGDLAARIAAAAPRTVCMPPTLLASCVDALSSVDTVVVAGERCPRGLAERLAVGRRMLNVYGPTETTIAALWADSARGDDVLSIGRPIRGYTAHVLDDDWAPVPHGSTGELHVGGPGVARGYRSRPGLTAARFPTLPSGERVYRTGDLVTVRRDGLLEFVGRRDDQVKVRGFRVELREVEQAVEELAEVTAAAAFVLETGDALGLAAVPGAGATVEVAAVRGHCRDRLPDFMVPGMIDIVPVLPTTANGKVDRELLAQHAATSAPVLAGRGPSTPREVEVCDAWSSVLDRPVTDVGADFFELGGHSLLAARVVAELRERTGVRLSMQDLLAHPTPAALAAELDRQGGDRPVIARTGSWLVPWSTGTTGRPTLLCVPPAGTGCGRFREWQAELGDAVSVVGVQLPGRETRLGEPHPSTLDEIVVAVAGELTALADPEQPLVVFGESFGGLVGYELARLLGEHGRWPAALVLAACEPPHLREDPETLVASIRRGIAGAGLDEDTEEQVIELVRKDVLLTVGYEPPPDPGIGSEVHVWGGDGDDLATPDKLDQWAAFLGRDVTRRQFAGGHVFAMHHAREIPQLLGEIVAPQGVPC
ncbi:MAG: AMP-binding protein [Actinophytocola sp.]|uniref:AMP-binding protein n=1 Tax=Actinophytocola sp. TaxID=1872138 RepID=UPI001329150C|nr:AMP-binding protein [Actinophytocola sp.]MPZ82753.1 AMP-binding protein [Actinophytocola sp.]